MRKLFTFDEEMTNKMRIKNEKSVKVRINDRGPYKKGRIIDLSYKAAQQIGMVKDGVTKVKIEIIKK